MCISWRIVAIVGILILLANPSSSQQLPFPISEYEQSITQRFREQNPSRGNKRHMGDDIGRPAGTPVLAVAPGTVKFARRVGDCGPNWGHVVVVEHTIGGDHFCTIYAHLNPETIRVSESSMVTEGQQIGEVGTWPQCSSHLHFGVHQSEYGHPVGMYPSWLAGYGSALHVAHTGSGEVITFHIVEESYNTVWPAKYCDPIPFLENLVCDSMSQVSVGGSLRKATVSNDGFHLFLVDAGLDRVSKYDTRTNQVVRTVQVGDSPFGSSISSVDERLFVTIQGEDVVRVLQTNELGLLDTFSTGDSPKGISLSPDDSLLYVVNSISDTVSVIDAVTGEPEGLLSVGADPEDVEIARDGRVGYISSSGEDSLRVFATDPVGQSGQPIPVGQGPGGIAVTPTGAVVLTANTEAGTVSIVDTHLHEVVATFPVGGSPTDIAVSSSGKLAFVSNLASDSVSVIRLVGTPAVVGDFAVGDAPHGLAIYPESTGTSPVLEDGFETGDLTAWSVTESGPHSLRFESANSQFVQIPSTAQSGLGLTGDFTIEAWINLASIQGQHIVRRVEDSGYVLEVGAGGQTITVSFRDGEAVSQFKAFNILSMADIGLWHHLAASVDVDVPSATIYLDGEAQITTTVFSETTTLPAPDIPFRIAAGSAGFEPFDGLLDEVRIWAYTRTAQEIARDFRVVLTGSEPGLVGYWRFEGNLRDSSSRGNHLTPFNGPVFVTEAPF